MAEDSSNVVVRDRGLLMQAHLDTYANGWLESDVVDGNLLHSIGGAVEGSGFDF